MNLAELLLAMSGSGLRLHLLPSDCVEVTGPMDRLTGEMKNALIENKSRLVEILAVREAADERDAIQWLDSLPESDAKEAIGQFVQDWTEISGGDRLLVVDTEAAGDEIAAPDPCPGCGGIERWQDVTGDLYCPECKPPRAGARLRERAERIRRRHPRGANDGENSHPHVEKYPCYSQVGDIRPETATPESTTAEPRLMCNRCGRVSVVRGQPGRPEGLCFRCWSTRR